MTQALSGLARVRTAQLPRGKVKISLGATSGEAKPRRRRSRGTITREAIVNAALSVVDQVGVERLSVRGVARAVNAPPMSLYTHFSSKEELLDLLYAQIVLRLYADSEHTTWQAGVLAVCTQVRTELVAHPRWAPLLSRPAPPLAVPVRERVLALMTSDGMSSEHAVSNLSSAVLIAIGLVLVELALKGTDGRSLIMQRYARLRTWTETSASAEHPTTRSALASKSRFDLAENFARSIHLVIAGLETTRNVPK